MTRRRLDLPAITALWLLLVVAVRPWGNFPANDDWSWALFVRNVVVDHVWKPTDFTGMPMVPQVLLGALFSQPFGFSLMALRASVMLFAWAGVAGLYTLLQDSGSPRPLTVVAVGTLIVTPFFFALSLTFMTDVPFLTLAVWSVVMSLRYIREPRPRRLAAVVALLTAAALQRQLGVPLALALAASIAVTTGWRQGVLAVVVPAVALAAYNAALAHAGATPLLYYDRYTDLTRAATSPSLLLVRAFAVNVLSTYVYLGVLMTPLVVATPLTAWRSTKAWALAGVQILIAGAGVLYKQLWMPIQRNILHDFSINLISIGRADLWPHAPQWLWVTLTLAGLVSAAVMWTELWVAARRLRGPAVVLAACLVLSVGPLWVIQMFDRYYLLPFVLLMALWISVTGGPATAPAYPRLAAAALLLAALAAVDVVALRDYYAFTRARWSAVDALISGGTSGDGIDGGFEVNGWLSYHRDRRPDTSGWWYLPKTSPRITLSLAPVAGYATIAEYPFTRLMPPGSGTVYALRSVEPASQQSPAPRSAP